VSRLWIGLRASNDVTPRGRAPDALIWARARPCQLAIATLVGLLSLLVLAPARAGADISKNQAARRALQVLAPQNARHPVVVFGMRHPVSGYVADAGPDSRQPIRYVRGSHGTQSVISATGTRLKRRVWLFWEDLVPYTEFAHPSILLLIDARTGRVQRRQQYEWWPVVNGSKPPFLQGDGYNNPRYRLFSNATPPRPARDLTAHTAQAQPSLPNDCLVQEFDGTDSSFVADAAQWARFASDSGFVPPYKTHTLAGMENALAAAANKGCTDALIYLGGHGFAATGANLDFGDGPLAESQFGQLVTSWKVVESQPLLVGSVPLPLPQIATRILTDTVSAASLADSLTRVNKKLEKSGKHIDYKLIIQSCFAGRFLQYERLDKLTKFIGGAAGATQGASGNLNYDKNGWYFCPDPSYYSKKLIDRLRTTPPGKLPDRLIQAATGLPAGPLGEQPVFWDGTNVVGEGGPPTVGHPCPGQGGIDLTLRGEFFGSHWAAGEVRATSNNGSAPQLGSVGYDSLSVSHFGPWQCGTTTTLTATPARGSHFDRWASDEGLCAIRSDTCTVPITTTAHQMTAYFAPTVYNLSVTNAQPDGVVYSRAGYLLPTISCGSKPNGSNVTLVYRDCNARALAQRSDTDVTQLEIDADSRGPGDRLYGVASIAGCDRSVATINPIPGGTGTYVPSVQCFIDMNSDRAITVTYKNVAPAH
jgi:hypothetical protein